MKELTAFSQSSALKVSNLTGQEIHTTKAHGYSREDAAKRAACKVYNKLKLSAGI